MAFKLADLFVQFSASGVDTFKKALDGVRASVDTVAKGVEAVGKTATIAFTAASAALTGFVRSGLQGTVQGEAISLRMTLLSREIASLFIPQINAAIDALDRVIDRFRRLSGEQQENIGNWLVGAGAALTFSKALTAIIPGIGPLLSGILGLGFGAEVASNGFSRLWAIAEPVLDGLKELWDALTDALAPVADILGEALVEAFRGIAQAMQNLVPVIKELLRLIEPLLVGMAKLAALAITFGAQGLVAATGQLRDFVGEGEAFSRSSFSGGSFGQEKSRQGVTPASGGVEQIQDAFRRIQAAALRQDLGKSIEEKQLTAQERTADASERAAKSLERLKPAFG